MGRRRRRRTCTWQFSLLFRHPQLFFYYNIGSARLLCTSAVVAVCVCTRASRGASRWPRLKTRANTRQTHRVAPPLLFILIEKRQLFTPKKSIQKKFFPPFYNIFLPKISSFFSSSPRVIYHRPLPSLFFYSCGYQNKRVNS